MKYDSFVKATELTQAIGNANHVINAIGYGWGCSLSVGNGNNGMVEIPITKEFEKMVKVYFEKEVERLNAEFADLK